MGSAQSARRIQPGGPRSAGAGAVGSPPPPPLRPSPSPGRGGPRGGGRAGDRRPAGVRPPSGAFPPRRCAATGSGTAGKGCRRAGGPAPRERRRVLEPPGPDGRRIPGPRERTAAAPSPGGGRPPGGSLAGPASGRPRLAAAAAAAAALSFPASGPPGARGRGGGGRRASERRGARLQPGAGEAGAAGGDEPSPFPGSGPLLAPGGERRPFRSGDGPAGPRRRCFRPGRTALSAPRPRGAAGPGSGHAEALGVRGDVGYPPDPS